MPASVLAQISALKDKPIGDLKALWRKLCNTEPPPYNRKFLQSRLAYRIQELAYGGLKAETVERLDAMAGDIGGKAGKKGRKLPGSGRLPARGWSRMGRGRALRHRAGGRLRLSGPPLQVPVGDRPRHRRHPLEWLDVLRPQERSGAMKNPGIEAESLTQAPLRHLHPQIARKAST